MRSSILKLLFCILLLTNLSNCTGLLAGVVSADPVADLANRIAIVPGGSVIFTAQSNADDGTVTIDSSSTFQNGYASYSGVGGTATAAVTFNDDANGLWNNCQLYVNHEDPDGAYCTNDGQFIFGVAVVTAQIANITGVQGSYQRVPIYAGDHPIQGIAMATIAPIVLPTGTSVTFKMKNIGGAGDANFDNNTKQINLTASGNLNIRGKTNSDSSENMVIDAYLNDKVITGDQSSLTFTVSTWPINFSASGGTALFPIVVGHNYEWKSESDSLSDLGNCEVRESVAFSSYPSPPFSSVYLLNGAVTVTSSGGGSGDFPTPPTPATTNGGFDQNGIDSSSLSMGTGNMVGHQYFQYKDTVIDTSWTTFDGGTYTITSSVVSAGAGREAKTVKTGGNGAPFTSGTVSLP